MVARMRRKGTNIPILAQKSPLLGFPVQRCAAIGEGAKGDFGADVDRDYVEDGVAGGIRDTCWSISIRMTTHARQDVSGVFLTSHFLMISRPFPLDLSLEVLCSLQDFRPLLVAGFHEQIAIESYATTDFYLRGVAMLMANLILSLSSVLPGPEVSQHRPTS